ncbi:MAG TPA: hypothetical protein VHB48_14880 [Chitinophagaceae bacterium]|nr:hypothetical protein [Chitinophagaceae bacterium]
MQVKNIDGLTVDQVKDEIANGGKFVYFQYTVSIVVMTFRRSSDIYFIKSDEKAVAKGLPYTLMSFFLGWWGIPWGPVYTIQSLSTNLGGGKDVTAQILPNLLGTN